MSYGDIGEGITGLINALFVVCGIMLPLAVWKIIDIIIWIFQHFQIVVK